MKHKVGLIVGALLLSNSTLASADSDFIDFALKQAHQKGFYQCDKAIKNTFSTAFGSDIRIFTDWFDGTRSDSLKLTGIYGKKGDTVFVESEYRVKSDQCYVTGTTVVTTGKSCTAYASELKSFDYVAETGDYIAMKSKGGIPMFLKPLGSSCIVTFQMNGVF
ncbi:hypothetical protein [Veronia pacifica]|uniref:Uncharacterized protein n=1 Tax=Veronia pacifica TaxID=1080227 RepID=A0A1C3EAG8_9GAMM|nr:hypothetical protein [Veronia pacifica]ODA30232.1 hypothetical protein A8L45_20740 [Veronia pacifica]